jgi:hypothetical protein
LSWIITLFSAHRQEHHLKGASVSGDTPVYFGGRGGHASDGHLFIASILLAPITQDLLPSSGGRTHAWKRILSKSSDFIFGWEKQIWKELLFIAAVSCPSGSPVTILTSWKPFTWCTLTLRESPVITQYKRIQCFSYSEPQHPEQPSKEHLIRLKALMLLSTTWFQYQLGFNLLPYHEEYTVHANRIVIQQLHDSLFVVRGA